MTINQEIPIGIDLGTTYSAIACLDAEGRPTTITNSEGELTTPSVVYFDEDAIIVGSEAVFAGESQLDRLARAAKRDMGQAHYHKLVLQRQLPPELIQSLVLKKLKADAELRLGPIRKAVVTVPAYFNEPRRKATQDAGELAGLEVMDIINEPTAAALAYGVQRGFLNAEGKPLQPEKVLVYDLGGGTFDVTLMELVQSQFNTIATAGDVYLGGLDWDQRLLDHARTEIERQTRRDLNNDLVLLERLLGQCVRAKKSLTARTETVIRIDHDGQRFAIPVTRSLFEELTSDLLERTRLTTEGVLRDAGLKWNDLTRLVLVGGATRMPMVIQMLEKMSGVPLDRTLAPDEAVAHGAAIYAGMLLQQGGPQINGISVTNVNSHDLGVLGLDPVSGKPRRKILIPHNHSLPAKSTKKFQTSKDDQRKIVVKVVEGGTEEGIGAVTIGQCVVTDLPPNTPKGTEVVVSFDYLSSGRLAVSAEIPRLGLSAMSEIDRASGMSPAAIETWKQRLASGGAFWQQQPTLPITDSNSEPKSTPKSAPKSAPNIETNHEAHSGVTPPAGTGVHSGIRTSLKPTSPPRTRQSVLTSAWNNPVAEFEVDEHSGIFVLGEAEAKPQIGSSFLQVLQHPDSSPQPEDSLGGSALDFLGDKSSRQTAMGDSALEFLKQIETGPEAPDPAALEEFLKDLNKNKSQE